MKNTILLSLAGVLFIITNSALATTFSEACPDLPTCAKVVGELLNQEYTYTPDLKGQIKATPNLILTKDNAEVLFTSALAAEGYSRVPLIPGKTFEIVRQRDARDSAVPIVTADLHNAPTLPDTWDIYNLNYHATSPYLVDRMARSVRSLMPAAARIMSWNSTLLVTDTAPNLKKMYALIQSMDVKPNAETLKKWDEQEKFWHKRELIEAEHPKAPINVVNH